MPDRYCLFEKLGFSFYHLIKKDVCVKYLSKNKFRVWRYLHLKLIYFHSIAGVYILENTPPPSLGGEYQLMSFGGKNMKRGREKGGKCNRKRKKGARKRKKGERK